MATTAGNIITAAFLKVGVGSPTSAQTASALISLNNLVSFLGADRFINVVSRESFTVAASDPEYTVGDGGQWDTDPPPIGVRSCYLRDASNYDTPIRVITYKEYDRLSNKSFTAKPTALYFVAEYPLPKVIFNSYPDSAYSAYFEFWKNFSEFALTTTELTTPPEYKEAFVYNLAISLGEDWDRKIHETVIYRARETRELIERLVAAQNPPPLAKFDFGGIGGMQDPGYDVVNDNLVDGGT